MSDTAELAREARELIAAARAHVAEWAEEGIASWDPSAARPSPDAGDEATDETELDAPAEISADARDEASATAHTDAEGPLRAPAPPATEPAAEPSRLDPGADSQSTEPLERVPEPPASPAPAGPPLTLDEVRAELGDCTRCGLHVARKSIVFGDGNPDADILFVGEGPGQNEDEQGLPFVGRAGELLTQMIEKGMGLARSDVYICNVVKCRPPRNRTPMSDEVSQCRPFLDGQIAAVKPRVIVALGKPAAGVLLGRDVAITRIRGTWHDYNGIPLMPTLHPAFVLRQYTEENRRAVWEDLKAVLARVQAG